VATTEVEDLVTLKHYEGLYSQKYEGIMLRNPERPYKQGRSTLKEFGLVKYKRFHDAEATIIGFEEQETNTNPKTKDALGHSVRSSHKAGKKPAGIMGKLIVHDEVLDKELEVGTGFTKEQREEIWANQKNYLGKVITYKYQEVLASGAPRFPSFKGFRPEVE